MNEKNLTSKAVELTDGDRFVLAEFDEIQELKNKIIEELQNYCLDALTIAGILEQVKLKVMEESYNR